MVRGKPRSARARIENLENLKPKDPYEIQIVYVDWNDPTGSPGILGPRYIYEPGKPVRVENENSRPYTVFDENGKAIGYRNYEPDGEDGEFIPFVKPKGGNDGTE